MRYTVSIGAHLAIPTMNETSGLAASIRLSRAGQGFGAMIGAGSFVWITSVVAALFVAMSARAGATFISLNRELSFIRVGTIYCRASRCQQGRG